MFLVNGIMVNHAGEPVDASGKVIPAKKTEAQSSTLQADLERAQLRIADLEQQLAEHADTGEVDNADARTNDELRAALDQAGVQYDAKAKKVALQALVAEHSI